jgi:tRNA(Ile)-lysidine synthase TilS/MesJ
MTAKAVLSYNMIDNGDKVLVAVSGGKDSVVMLDALYGFKRFGKVDFEMEAIHIAVDDVPYSVDKDFFTDYCQGKGIPFHYITISAGMEKRGKKAPCFVCSWHRRKRLFTFAKENGFKKLALGHHMDDAVETLLINMTYHANITSLPGKLKMFEGAMYLIRPLILLRDFETLKYAKIKGFENLSEECPYSGTTNRNTARNIIEQLEKLHPGAVANIFNSLKNISNEYLP